MSGTTTTPSIRISHHQRYPSPSRYPSFSSSSSAHAAPMAIPRAHDLVPPPLPPPPFLPDLTNGHDPGWQWGNDPSTSDFGKPASVKPGSSLLGGGPSFKHFAQEKEHDYPTNSLSEDTRRASSISTITSRRDDVEMTDGSLTPSDEDGSGSRPLSSYRLKGERQLEQRTREESSSTYDKQVLSRIGGPNGGLTTPKRLSISQAAGSGSMQETAQLAHAEAERRNGQLRPLSMPERRQTSLDSPASSRWPQSGAISPRASAFWPEPQQQQQHGPFDASRNPASSFNTHLQTHTHTHSHTHTHAHTPTRHGSLTLDDNISQRGSFDHSAFIPEDLMEDGQMGSLNIHDRSPGGSAEDYHFGPRAGTKRRASSPPRDPLREERTSVSSASGQSEIFQRRTLKQQFPNRGSPISRFHPNLSSLSSASSYGMRNNSLGSSLGMASIASSATSYASGRLSPSALSPAFDTGNSYQSSNVNAIGLAAQDASVQRSLADGTQSGALQPAVDRISHARNGAMSHLPGMYICECCPKKPRKFDTEEDLRLHESEKQYTCAYCPNRFKNKNEAERHQNSLHLRRHSWSCAALAGAEAAFHSSTSEGDVDVCGYCGDEFTNPPQWNVRAEHLNTVHKFGECNQTKKFFRADHFRQHLKHSHGGTSGKWTNMLEIACMKDEPLPEKRVTSTMTSGHHQAPPALMVSTAGLAGSQHHLGGRDSSEENSY